MEEFGPVLACCRRISRGSGNNLGELFQKICHWGRYALNLQNNLESLLKMNFQLIGNAEGSNARAGLIDTDHGQIETPIFLTSSTCHPKFVGKERCNALMTFHEHCFADCLLVLRKVYLYCYDCLCERQHFVDAHPDL